MTSFSAELRVSGQSFPVLQCAFGVEQATHQRGRVSTKVRYGPVQLVLSVPEDDTLFGWANDAQKRQPAQVFFRDSDGGSDGGSVLETLELKAAYCVSYHEQFVSGDARGGAYQCYLTLSDPGGWTLTAGGPASAFVAPAARNHGLPGAAADALERETSNDEEMGVVPTPHFASLVEPSQGLAVVLASCLSIKQPQVFDPEIDPNLFRNQVITDLEKIYATHTGKKMLESLADSGKKVTIHHSINGNAIGGYRVPEGRFLQVDGPGIGTDSNIAYNPSVESVGKEDVWETRPPAIGLAHELIHAEQAAYGRMPTGKAPNGPLLKHPDSKAEKLADIRELEAVGVPPHDKYPFSENKIRAEWDPKQPPRDWY
ncbi:hypothetical protein GCM10022409_42890 [Hymenobacter glaciei]|uniref:Tox-MPTase4 domain-containing protein n=1 Tax=Hymenobacter glaciei TaxID=877209 RepID=A0ABP7USI3_9BACT